MGGVRVSVTPPKQKLNTKEKRATCVALRSVVYLIIALGLFEVHQAVEAVSQLKNDEQRMTTILRENTSFTAKELKKFYEQGESITPEKAKIKGVIDDIKDVSISSTTKSVVVPTSR